MRWAEPTPFEEQSTEEKIGTIIRAWTSENDFNGIIRIIFQPPDQDGQVYDNYILGLADRDTGRQLTAESVFQTGSVGKLFTSVAIFALADEGVLDIDAPISTYLPDYRKDLGDKITLAHLMSNRSGLDDGYSDAFGEFMGALSQNPDATFAELGMDFSVAEGFQRYAQRDLKFEPGSEFDYAFINWVFVHHILETVTNKPMSKVLEQYVFGPAQMPSSGTFIGNLYQLQAKGLNPAIGYNAGGNITTDYPLPPFIGGGTYTNAADMTAFLQALHGGKLISEAGMARFVQITTLEEDYAYGGRIRAVDGALYSWQSGSNGATKMVAIHEIGGDFTFTALSNRAHDQGDMFDLAIEVKALAN